MEMEEEEDELLDAMPEEIVTFTPKEIEQFQEFASDSR